VYIKHILISQYYARFSSNITRNLVDEANQKIKLYSIILWLITFSAALFI